MATKAIRTVLDLKYLASEIFEILVATTKQKVHKNKLLQEINVTPPLLNKFLWMKSNVYLPHRAEAHVPGGEDRIQERCAHSSRL
jgi:hypothetical protein